MPAMLARRTRCRYAAARPWDDDPMASGPGATYPVAWEADVVLRDGSVAHVRPITPDDAEALRDFHRRQSPESIYLRFFAPLRELSDRDVHRFTHVDHRDRVALIATVRDDIVGVGRFDRIDEHQARSPSTSATTSRDAASARSCSSTWR